jgi:hypothetical protein
MSATKNQVWKNLLEVTHSALLDETLECCPLEKPQLELPIKFQKKWDFPPSLGNGCVFHLQRVTSSDGSKGWCLVGLGTGAKEALGLTGEARSTAEGFSKRLHSRSQAEFRRRNFTAVLTDSQWLEPNEVLKILPKPSVLIWLPMVLTQISGAGCVLLGVAIDETV